MAPESGVFLLQKTMKLIIKTKNPYDYNSVVAAQMEKKEEKEVKLTPSADSLLQNPTANALGKFLGIDNKREWSQYYDKVALIYNWAKEKAGGSEDPQYLTLLLKEKLNSCPELSPRRIDDLYCNIKLEAKHSSEEVK